jgi:predicted kinase/predicted phosphodiesterase
MNIMRKLYILRGVQGCGKSSFLRQHDLESYTISSDLLRKQFESTVFDSNGNPYITQENNKAVWTLLFQLVESRMKKNCLTFVDATHCSPKDLKPYRELAKKYKYELKIIDFDVPLDTLLERNKQRPTIQRLNEYVIKKFYERKKVSINEEYNVIKPEEITKELIYEIKDLSKYEKIVFFGDLQGCYSSIENYFKDNPYNKNYLYIFVGDLVDRGIENDKVMQFMLDFSEKKNVIIIKGNHEYHLDRWARGEKAKSRVFNEKTLPQLYKADIKKSEVNYFCKKLIDFLRFKYYEKEITVTHAGLPFSPKNENIYKMPSHQFIKGIGSYSDNVDTLWNEQTEDFEFQIHGHRNKLKLPIINNRSINLEGSVEYGNFLRILELSKDGFKPLEYKQDIFDKDLKRVKMEKNMTFLEKLRNNDFVYEKDLGDNISSFNFSREAFYKKEWNETNIKARGLFIDVKQNKIIARSYNKFFNKGERKETEPDVLKKNLKFPAIAYQKDNGFLGVLGMKNGELFYASKSTNKSDFAKWFKDIVEETLNTEEIKKILSKGNMSMVFEVNDPINDPHIIKYKKAHVVLLDIIHNKENFSKLPYTQLRGIAKKINSPVKILTKVFKTWEEYEKWYHKVNKKDNLLEGYVIEDSNGFMFKIKLPYYSFWKYMRTVRDRLKRDKEVTKKSLKDRGYETFFL